MTYLRSALWPFLTLCLMTVFAACERMKVGYLQAENAAYAPDTVFVIRNLDPADSRAVHNSPWNSSPIQGVAGTAPLKYEFVSVTAANGGDAEKFQALVKSGEFFLQGSVVLLKQEGVARIPNGNYTLTLRVSNEDHHRLLKDVITLSVSDN